MIRAGLPQPGRRGTRQRRQQLGITDDLVRISVGIEDVDDLLTKRGLTATFFRFLTAVKKARMEGRLNDIRKLDATIPPALVDTFEGSSIRKWSTRVTGPLGAPATGPAPR